MMNAQFVIQSLACSEFILQSLDLHLGTSELWQIHLFDLAPDPSSFCFLERTLPTPSAPTMVGGE
jgi:hypothetical protein